MQHLLHMHFQGIAQTRVLLVCLVSALVTLLAASCLSGLVCNRLLERSLCLRHVAAPCTVTTLLQCFYLRHGMVYGGASRQLDITDIHLVYFRHASVTSSSSALVHATHASHSRHSPKATGHSRHAAAHTASPTTSSATHL